MIVSEEQRAETLKYYKACASNANFYWGMSYIEFTRGDFREGINYLRTCRHWMDETNKAIGFLTNEVVDEAHG